MLKKLWYKIKIKVRWDYFYYNKKDNWNNNNNNDGGKWETMITNINIKKESRNMSIFKQFYSKFWRGLLYNSEYSLDCCLQIPGIAQTHGPKKKSDETKWNLTFLINFEKKTNETINYQLRRAKWNKAINQNERRPKNRYK